MISAAEDGAATIETTNGAGGTTIANHITARAVRTAASFPTSHLRGEQEVKEATITTTTINHLSNHLKQPRRNKYITFLLLTLIRITFFHTPKINGPAIVNNSNNGEPSQDKGSSRHPDGRRAPSGETRTAPLARRLNILLLRGEKLIGLELNDQVKRGIFHVRVFVIRANKLRIIPHDLPKRQQLSASYELGLHTTRDCGGACS